MPLKGYKSMIRIDRERYLKHMVTDLETPNEPTATDFPILGNYSCDSHFGNFAPLLTNVPLTQNSKIIFQEESLMPIEDSLFCQNPTLGILEEKVGEQNTGEERERGEIIIRKFGPSILMDLNHKKGQDPSAYSSIRRVNVISYPVD